MSDQDWTAGRFVRIFASLQTDYPEVWRSDRLLAWYVRLLDQADGSWPHASPWPRALPEEVEEALVAAGAIDREGTTGYLVSGLDRLRTETAARGTAGGKARAATALRVAGRFAGNVAGHTNGNAGPLAGALAGPPAGRPSLETSEPHQRTSLQTRPESEIAPPTSGLSRDLDTSERAHDRGAEAPTTIACRDYQAHRFVHVQVPNIGWRCPPCEVAKAQAEPSFADRVGWTPPATRPPAKAAEPRSRSKVATPFRDQIRDAIGYVPGEEEPPDDRPF